MNEPRQPNPTAAAADVQDAAPVSPSPAMAAGQASGAPVQSGEKRAAAAASAAEAAGARLRFGSFELVVVLSYFDIGIIEAVQEFPRGSRKSPKLLIRTDQGLFLLKRRARTRDDAYKTAFCHKLQLYLAERQFPLPHLVGTKTTNNSMLQLKDGIYELFEYIKGNTYDNSLRSTEDAGRTLAVFHQLLREYESDYEPPTGSYHASRSVVAALQMAPAVLAKFNPDMTREQQEQMLEMLKFLHASYRDAVEKVNELGLDSWPKQIIHGDWHPGNMVFRHQRVAAVIDYDAARLQQRIIDIANGALQFSILGGGEDASNWPDYLDESRFKRFVRGYDSIPGCVLSRAEIHATPWLMIEALIAESAIPIAATGHFGRMPGLGFLQMIERKVRWLQQHSEVLVRILTG